MPKMAKLFSRGQVSLAQMGTAARQIRRLPDAPAWPDQGGNSSSAGSHADGTDSHADFDAFSKCPVAVDRPRGKALTWPEEF